MKGAQMRPFLTDGEAAAFNEIWSYEEGASMIDVPTPSEALRDAWRSVADVRDTELVKVVVFDLHARMVHTMQETLSSGAKLRLLRAYSDAFVVFLMLKLPAPRRRDLPLALVQRHQPTAYVESAERFYEFLLDREEQGGSVSPLWEDLQDAVASIVEAWQVLEAESM